MSVKRDHFRIRHVSEVTGIPRQTLISWERRHGLVTPDRTENGYRYYSRDDIELLHIVRPRDICAKPQKPQPIASLGFELWSRR